MTLRGMCQMGTSQPRSLFPCFLNPVPPLLGDLSCIPGRPMSVSAAATALYKSLPWQPAAPRLSNLTSATRYTFSLTSFCPLRLQILVAVPLLRECTQTKSDALICQVLTCFGKHPLCVERLFAAFSAGRMQQARRGAVIEHDSPAFVWVGGRKWAVPWVTGWFETL